MATKPDRIDVETASEYLESGRALFLDARPSHSRANAIDEVPGSVRVAPGSGAGLDDALEHLPRELVWIVYCDEPNQASSAQVARRARELGLNDASVLEGGLRRWIADGGRTVPLRAIEALPARGV